MRRVPALVVLLAAFPALPSCAGEGPTDTGNEATQTPVAPSNVAPGTGGSQPEGNTGAPQQNVAPSSPSVPDGPALGPTPSTPPANGGVVQPTNGSSTVTPPAPVAPDVAPATDPSGNESMVNPAVDNETTDDTGVNPVDPQDTGPTPTTDTSDTGPEPDDGTGDGNPQPDVDQNGKANAAPGESTSAVQDYLRLGEIRILNNNWGSAELGCDTQMSVFVNPDKSFGWDFNRGSCGGGGSQPDFPQIEFGIHPFGIGHELVTSPEFSSTTLLPLQIHAIQSASVSVQNMAISLQAASSWNITFEFWLSEEDPVNHPNPQVYAELMTFWGWQNGRWPEPPGGMGPVGNGANDKVPSAGKNYTLWVQDDNWAGGKWRYFQFRDDSGPQGSFNGTLDVKPFLDYLVARGYSQDLWVTRLEVGSEIDDNTGGRVTLSNITFEVNGESRSPVFSE